MDTAYCRLCAELKPNKKLVDVHKDADTRLITSKLVRINASTDFNIETLPKTVCFVCLTALDRAYELVNGIEAAQAVLKDLILVQHIKKESFSDSETCATIFFEAEDDVKYENAISVKEESEQSNSQLPQNANKKRIFKAATKLKAKKKVTSTKNILDTIPLSQLHLTWKDFDWACAYCGTQFATCDELKEHSIQVHSCCNAYRCPDCNTRKLRLEKFIQHMRIHRKYLKFSCYKCYLRFPTPHEVNKHRKCHITTTYVCSGCNSSFENQEEKIKHCSVYFRDLRSRHVPLDKIGSDGVTCKVCEKTFKRKTSLHTHLLTHTERKRNYTCDQCGKCFISKSCLSGHMVVHSDLSYTCEICKHQFKSLTKLRNHVKVHDQHKPYACSQCGRCFRLKKQLDSHSIIHTDLLPHICTYCNKAFRFKTILNQHLRQHTGVKPYSCEICSRDFTNWPNFNKHMKRRHNMNMAKKKHTAEGIYPINPVTGEIMVFPETNTTMEWKKKMLLRRPPGRPKITGEIVPETTEESEVTKVELEK